MVFIYKNFLIINRADSIQNSVDMAKKMGAWFNDDEKIWHTKSPVDKIILVYKDPFRTDDIVKEYKTNNEVDFRPHVCIGFIKMYCQTTHVKVSSFLFKVGVDQLPHWIILKKYLIQIIKNAGMTAESIRVNPCTIHWEMCSDSHKASMAQIGLISDYDKNTYTFLPIDLEDQVQQSQWNSSLNEWGGQTVQQNPKWKNPFTKDSFSL